VPTKTGTVLPPSQGTVRLSCRRVGVATERDRLPVLQKPVSRTRHDTLHLETVTVHCHVALQELRWGEGGAVGPVQDRPSWRQLPKGGLPDREGCADVHLVNSDPSVAS